jgi:hypothetical protein
MTIEATTQSERLDILQAITTIGEQLRIGKEQAEAFLDPALASDTNGPGAPKGLLLGIKLILARGEKQNVEVAHEFVEHALDGSASLRVICSRVSP